MSKSTTRRAVLAGVVTMPIAAAAVAVPALAATEVAVLQQLGDEVRAAYDALGVVIHVEEQTPEWEQREADANDKLDDALDAVCSTPARSIRGLIVKARIGEIDRCEFVAQKMASSIIDDLLTMEGV